MQRQKQFSVYEPILRNIKILQRKENVSIFILWQLPCTKGKVFPKMKILSSYTQFLSSVERKLFRKMSETGSHGSMVLIGPTLY